jgi:NhaP-type Na+/H+ or K+/H+ antiporter
MNGEAGVSASESADASMLLPLVFLMIIGTVIVQGGSAKFVAKWLKVERQTPEGVLFVGANEAARYLASYLQKNDVPVILVDTSHSNVADARNMRLTAYEGSILKENVTDEMDFSSTGRLVALTSSSEINMLACKIFQEEFGEENTYRLISRRENELKDLEKPKNLMFDGSIDYYNLLQTIRKKPKIKELEYGSEAEFEEFMIKNKKRIIPLFMKTANNYYKIYSGFNSDYSKGEKLIYIDDRTENQESEDWERNL